MAFFLMLKNNDRNDPCFRGKSNSCCSASGTPMLRTSSSKNAGKVSWCLSPDPHENRRRLNTGFCTLSKVESQVLEKKLQCSQKLHRFFVFACDKWQIFWVSSLMKCHCFPVIPAGSEGMSVLPSIHTLFGMYWIHRSLTSMLNNTLNKAFPNSLLIQSRSWTTF